MFPSQLLAVGDEFTVKSQITGVVDSIPPTTPVISGLTPISTTQIDVVWGASTDNVSVSGYQVFRNAVQVATTTLTNYSDTGLSASSPYSYTVRAFDTSNNFSTTSAAVVASTLTSSGGSGGQRLIDAVDLFEINITTTKRSATIAWKTDTYSHFTFRYGRTNSYELGFVSSDILRLEHLTTITDLEPGTTYAYELIGYDQEGNDYVLSRDQFVTDRGDDVNSPANVLNLNATQIGSGVQLSWQNPPDSDFAYVRILRNHNFFPTDPFAGFLVYQGDAIDVLDQQAFVMGPNQYYTVYSYDQNGNISSGAVVWISETNGAQPVVSRPVAEGTPTPTTTDELIPSIPPLKFSDIQFIQNGEQIFPDNSNYYSISGDENVTVRLPYERLPQHLKAIRISLTHPDETDQVFSFLLRVNKDKTAYEATFAPLAMEGVFDVSVDVFDFKTEVNTQVTGALDTTIAPSRIGESSYVVDPRVFIITTSGALAGILLIILLIFWSRLSRSSQ